MFDLENRGETLLFMLRHIDKTMAILISHFLRFDVLKISTVDYFVLGINKIIYSKHKIGCFSFQYFSQHFSYSRFSLILSSVVPLVVNGGSIGNLKQLPRNARRDFFQTHARRCGW